METTLTYYHLGSWTTITGEDGEIYVEQSFDAWGNSRDPYTWTGTNTTHCMFDRGFTGHEMLYDFGLINMNGRMYDPVMSSFLSVDSYVQSPENSQNFNRYAYCLNNPLKYTDPSGWYMNEPYMASYPAWSFGDNMSYEPRDLQYNSPYMFSCSLSGGGGVSYGGGGGSFARTYGYSVVNSSYYINNNFYVDRELALRGPTIRDVSNAWWKDPSRETNQALVDAGISELNVGVLEKDGLRHGTATIEVGGEEYSLPLPTLEVGGDDYYFGVTVPCIDLASNAGPGPFGLQKANIMAQSLGVPMGAITEGFECAAKSAYGIPLLKPSSGLTSAQKVSVLTKEGAGLLKTTKFLGNGCAVASVSISGIMASGYYLNGGTGLEVGGKFIADAFFAAVGIWGGPIGLLVCTGYMIADWATDGFGVSYEIKP